MNALTRLMDSAKDAERVGSLDVALERYERAFDRCREEGDAAIAAALLRWIGNVRRARGDVELAIELYEASLAIAERNDFGAEEAAALNCLAIANQARGDVDRALMAYTRARRLAEAIEDDRLVAMIEQNMGALANMQGRLADALGHYRTAVELARRIGDQTTVSHALNNIGMAHLDLEEWEDAERYFDESSELAEANDDAALVGTVALNRAELHLRCGRAEAGLEACHRALSVFNLLRSKPSLGEVYKLYGMLCQLIDEPEQAEARFASALGLAEATDDVLLQAETRVEWASLHLAHRRWQQGITYLNGALLAFGQLKAGREILDIQRRLERAENVYIGAVNEWARMMAARAGVESGIRERVVERACTLARSCGLDGWALTTVRVGALIHDVGSAAVHDCAPPRSPHAERLMRKVATIAGDAIARQLDFPPEIRAIVRSHRERWDGAGDPDGLAGEAIPLGARMVAIANTFEKLRQGTAELRSLTPGDALRELQRERGAFDPVLLERFAGIIADQSPSTSARSSSHGGDAAALSEAASAA